MTRLALLLLLTAGPAWGQIETATALLDSLGAAAAHPDADARLGAIWDGLAADGRIPFVAGDSAVWARAERLDPAARIDYKWIVDGTWILDPNNPHQQWGGVGPNSELRMPGWVFPAETVLQPGVARGMLSATRTIASARYGRTVTYRVWTPAGTLAPDRPTVYVTDGHEYADTRLGAMPTVLDNLVAQGRIEPPVVVFIDPRVGGENRRSEQYVQNAGFAAFVAQELVPVIDAAYPTRRERGARVILGTSLGGLFSAYLGLEHPDVFGRLAIHSPAFWVSERPSWTGASIYQRMGASPATFQIAMTTGTVNDTQDGARQMRDVLTARADGLTYAEVPEGHSWGNWRATLDVLLEALLPIGAVADEARPSDVFRLTISPNPSSGPIRLRVEGAHGRTQFTCADSLGRTVWQATGASASVPARHLAAGVYQCSATSNGRRDERAVTVVR